MSSLYSFLMFCAVGLALYLWLRWEAKQPHIHTTVRCMYGIKKKKMHSGSCLSDAYIHGDMCLKWAKKYCTTCLSQYKVQEEKL